MKSFKPGMRTFLVLTAVLTLLCLGGAAQAYSVKTYQTTLGSPSGIPIGNVHYPGSDVTVQNAIAAAIGETLGTRTTYTPEEATVWGDGGLYGGQLYMLSVVAGIEPGALLEIHKKVDYMYEGYPTLYPWGDGTFYFPMVDYTQSPGNTGNTYLTQFSNVGDGPYTFVTGLAFAQNLATGEDNGGGSANNPPPAINGIPSWFLRQQLDVKVITGDWVLEGEATDNLRGYQYGTGYHDGGSGLTVFDLGSFENISYVSAVPEPATMLLLGLGLVGLAGFRREFK